MSMQAASYQSSVSTEPQLKRYDFCHICAADFVDFLDHAGA